MEVIYLHECETDVNTFVHLFTLICTEEEGEGFAQSIDNLILELDEKKEESKKRNNRGTIRIPKQEEADEFDMLIAQLDVPLQPQPEPEHAMASVQLRLQPETAIPTFRSGSFFFSVTSSA
jgi:hypothetical protein